MKSLSNRQQKIILYGAGNRCLNICDLVNQISGYDVRFIVDGNRDKWGKRIGKWEIMPPEVIRGLADDLLCITIADEGIAYDVRHKLEKEYGYNCSYEIGYEQLMFELFKRLAKVKFKEKFLPDEAYRKTEYNYIIFDCYTGLGLGGIEAWTKDVCSGLLNRNWGGIRILSDLQESVIPDELVGIVDKVKRDNAVWHGVNNFWYVADYLLRNIPFTVVTSHTGPVLIAACILKDKYPDKIKIISVIHNGTEGTYRNYMIYREYVDLYIGVSQDIRNAMIQRGMQEEKVYAMACPFACKQKLLRGYSLDNSQPIRIGYAGRLDGMEHSQKRMDLVLKLMKELADRNVNFKMELAGDGSVKKQMEQFVHKEGLCNNVAFLGNLERSALDSFWRGQDIFISLSDYEGRSISRLEAMANGAVPISTEVSGTKEDIIDDVNGYLVPLRSCTMMADRIEYLSNHRERLREMGEAAHEAVYPKSFYNKHFDFWEELLNGKRYLT